MTSNKNTAMLPRHFSGFAVGKIAFPLRESKREMMQFSNNGQRFTAVPLSEPGG